MAGGGKSTTQQTSSPLAPLLAQISSTLFGEAQPTTTALGNQTAQALNTGGVTAQVPIINRALDASRAAYTTSIESLRQNLARWGQGSSTSGQSVLAGAQQAGQQQVAATGPQTTLQFLQSALPMIFGLNSNAIGAGGTAGGLSNTQTTTPGFWDFFVQSLNGGAGLFKP